MNTNTFIVYALVIAAFAFMVVRMSCQSRQLDVRTNELKEARQQIDALNSEINMAAIRIREASERIDKATSILFNGEHKAYEDNAQRLESISTLEKTGNTDVQDWLCNPVPDDVCQLFNGTTGAMLPE